MSTGQQGEGVSKKKQRPSTPSRLVQPNAKARPGPKAQPAPKTLQPRAKALRSDIKELRPVSHESELLHDLQVHQLELEMQNEELQSARRESEQALRRYTELFDFAPIGYLSIRADHVIASVNHLGAELLGSARALLQGRRIEQLVAPEHHIALRNLLVSAEISPGRKSGELELFRNGTRFPARVSAAVMGHSDPQILLAFEDISERRQREQKLQSTEQALREADRRKDEFLAVLSHELRNPLAPIRQGVFLLARAAANSEVAQRAQLIVERQVSHLTRLVDELLDVARIARGKVHLQLHPVELGSVLRQSMDDHRPSFDAAGIELVSHIASEPCCVRADSVRMTQILSNVLSNALKFTPRGGHVEVALEQTSDACTLSVSDTGVGVSPEMLERIFEPFAQAPQTLDRAGGGLGLGLAMVKGLVELQGGQVSLHSRGIGHGMRVVITLPRCAAPDREEGTSPAPAPRRARRVLVIEDNLDAAEMLQISLRMSGHEVRSAQDGPTGLELATDFSPDVVICDIGLPGMDGYAVARAFRSRRSLEHVLLVALSGYAQPEDLRRAREAGFDQHLAKPASLDMIEHLLA